MNCPRERAENFIVKRNDDRNLRQFAEVFFRLTALGSRIWNRSIACNFVAHKSVVLVFVENFPRFFFFFGFRKNSGSIFAGTRAKFFLQNELVVVPIAAILTVLKTKVGRNRLDVNVRLLNIQGIVVEAKEDVKGENCGESCQQN